MPHVQGISRETAVVFPSTLDEYITADNPVRFIDAFVDDLDLEALGFARVVSAETGRPAYHPSDLLKLYVYGCLNRSTLNWDTEERSSQVESCTEREVTLTIR